MGFSVSELIIGLISSVSALVVGNSNVVKQPQVDLTGKSKTSIEGSQTSGKEGKIDRSQMGRSFSEGGTTTSQRGSSSSSSQNDLVSRGHYAASSDQRNLPTQSQGGSFMGEPQSSSPSVPLQSHITVGQQTEAPASSGHRPSAHTSSRASEGAVFDGPSPSHGISEGSGYASGFSADSAGTAIAGGSSTSSIQEAEAVPSIEHSGGLSLAESKLLQDNLDSKSRSDLNAAEMNVLEKELAIRSKENKDLQKKLQSKGKLHLSSQEVKALQDKLKLNSGEIKRLQDQLAFHVAKNKELQAALAAGKKPADQDQVQDETGKIVNPQGNSKNPINSEKKRDTRKSPQLKTTTLKQASQDSHKETVEEKDARLKKEFADSISNMRARILAGKGKSAENKSGKLSEAGTDTGASKTSSVDLNAKLEDNRRQQIALQTEIENFTKEMVKLNAANLQQRAAVEKRQKAAIERFEKAVQNAKEANKKIFQEKLTNAQNERSFTVAQNKKKDEELKNKLEKLEQNLLSLKKEEERFVKALAKKNDSEDLGTTSGTSGLSSSKNGKQISSDALGNAKTLLEKMLTERAYNNLLSDTKLNRELVQKIGSLDKDQIESLEHALLSEPLQQLRFTKLTSEIDNIISGYYKKKAGKVKRNIISSEVTIDALSGKAGSISSPSLLSQAAVDPVLQKKELESDLRELIRKDEELKKKLGIARSYKGKNGVKAFENFTQEKVILQKKIEEIKAVLDLIKTSATSLISSVVGSGVGGTLVAEAAEHTKLTEEIKAEKEALMEIENEKKSLELQAKSPTKDQLSAIDKSKRLKFINDSRARVKEAGEKLKEIELLKAEKLRDIKERETKALALKRQVESEALSQKFISMQENSDAVKRTISSNEQAILKLESDLAEKKKFYESQKALGVKLPELRKLTQESDLVLEQIEELKKATKSEEDRAEQLRLVLRDMDEEIEKEKQLRIEEQANFEKEKLEAEKAEERKKLLAKLGKMHVASDGNMDILDAIKSPQKFKNTGVTPVKSYTGENKKINSLLEGFNANYPSSTSESTTTAISTNSYAEQVSNSSDEEAVKFVIRIQPEITRTPEKKTKEEEDTEAAAKQAKTDLLQSGLTKRAEDFDNLDDGDDW